MAQEAKRNNNWAVGFEPVVKFKFKPILTIDTVQNYNLPVTPGCAISSSSACISDSSGLLALFGNGFILYDSLGFGIENGVYVNCPKGNILANYYGGRSLFDQSSLILPRKGNTYYVFSTGMSDSVATNYLNHVFTEFDVLNYSIVDMDSNAGKGKVTVKNKILLDNQHYVNCALTAVKHGNGKDWWLVKTDCWNHQLQLFLVKEDTIVGPTFYNIIDTGDYCVFSSQIYFSDDGTKFASSIYGNWIDSSGIYTYNLNRVDLYDFDRCNGTFNYRNQYVVPFDSTTYIEDDYKMGICFSPNGKLIYMSTRYSIYQIDIEDTNINNGIFISGPDTTLSYFPRYSLMASASNGKLYIGNRNGTRKFMSYIDKPNIRGIGCDFMPQGLWQPYTNLMSPPNMPNYGLGKAPISSTCWPQDTNDVVKEDDIKIYPNPTNHFLHIDYVEPFKIRSIQIFDAIGQLVLRTNETIIDVSRLSNGIYFVRVGNVMKKVLKD
jgi:hypothetical protein